MASRDATHYNRWTGAFTGPEAPAKPLAKPSGKRRRAGRITDGAGGVLDGGRRLRLLFACSGDAEQADAVERLIKAGHSEYHAWGWR